MLKLQRIRFKNLMSFGNTWTDYFFKSGITRLTGENGKGKSAGIIESLHFVMFGKPYRKINIGQLINTYNKTEMVVELEFTINSDSFKIIRGLKPNIFEIYKNGEIVPQPSHNRSYQAILQEDILHLDPDIFNQTVVKSSTRKISFLTLPKGDKRRIVETILNIEVFSLMRDLAKNNVNDLKSEINIIKKDLSSTKQMMEQELANIEKLRNIQRKIEEEAQNQVEQDQKRIDDIDKVLLKIEEGYQRLKRYEKDLKEKTKELADHKANISSIKESIHKEEVNLGLLSKKVAMFEEHCKGCEKIELMKKTAGKSDIEMRLSALNSEMESAKNDRDSTSEKIDKARKMLLHKQVLDIEKAKQIKERERITKKSGSQIEVDIDDSRYEELKTQQTKFEKKFNETSSLSDHYQIVKDLMSDDGIKTFIIQKYLPYINKLLNVYLEKFSAETIFNFDVEFNEIVASRYKESFTYNSFSEGQKRRIDLAVLFTFLDFCKIKNQKSDVNVLLLDEVANGLDPAGENTLFEILREVADKEKKEIIIISHSMGIDNDKVDRFYHVGSEKGFSTIKQIGGEEDEK